MLFYAARIRHRRGVGNSNDLVAHHCFRFESLSVQVFNKKFASRGFEQRAWLHKGYNKLLGTIFFARGVQEQTKRARAREGKENDTNTDEEVGLGVEAK